MFGRCVVAASAVVRQQAAAKQQKIRRASFIRVRSLRDRQRVPPPENKFRLTRSQNEVSPARNGCKLERRRGWWPTAGVVRGPCVEAFGGMQEKPHLPCCKAANSKKLVRIYSKNQVAHASGLVAETGP